MLVLPIQMIKFVGTNDPNIHVHSHLRKNVLRAIKFVVDTTHGLSWYSLTSVADLFACNIPWRMPLKATNVIIDIFDMIV